MDVPALAARDGCLVYGSTSLAALMHLHDLGDQAVVVEPYEVYEVGPFEISFVPSVHSKLVLGMRIPAEGELTCEHAEDLTSSAYRCGDVWGIEIRVAGVSFYHQGSADLLDHALGRREVDFLLAGIAGRGFTERYWERILARLSPRVIVPHHHDNFFLPLDGPMGFSFNVNYGGFLEEVARVSTDLVVCSLDLLQTIDGTRSHPLP
jgi:L-ascorbate metabolism protein UlaG (beta-lactamase superfamily)